MGQRTTAKSNARDRSGRDSVRTNVTFPVRSPIRPMAQLPRTGSGPVTARVGGVPALQAKLKVNPSGDAYERQADSVADSVMRAPKESPLAQPTGVRTDSISRMPSTGGNATELKDDSKQLAQPLQRVSRSPLRQHPQAGEEFEESGSPLLQRAEKNGGEGDSTSRPQPVQRRVSQADSEKPIQTALKGNTEEPSAPVQRKERDEQTVSRQAQKPEEEAIMRRSRGKGDAPPIPEGFAAQLHSSHGEGKPLPPDHRQFLESQLASDLDNVRVHEGPKATNLNRSINAQAFTRGSNIYFDNGAYDPNSSSGQRLLAHELTHVVQQGHAAPLSSSTSSSPQALQSTSTQTVQRRETPGELEARTVPSQEKIPTPGMQPDHAAAVTPQAPTLANKEVAQSRDQQAQPGTPPPAEPGEAQGKQVAAKGTKEEAKPGGGETGGGAPGGETREAAPEAPAVPSPREAIAPVISAVGQRAAGARKHAPAGKAVSSAQAAAINPKTEQTRSAATQTVANLDAAKAEEVKRNEFKAKLKQAIDAATPQPKTEAEAEKVQKTGAAQASQTLRGQLATERAVAAGPLQSAAGAEVSPSAQQAPPKTELQTEPVGPPPAPVPAGPVAPASLPPQRLDYSSDRAETDQAMAQNNITKEQLAEGNDPAFGPTLQARTEAEKHEAGAEAQYRQAESKEQQKAQGEGQKALVQGLTGVHGTRTSQLGVVTKQQQATKEKDAAERQRITDHITGIKNKTREQVEAILREMETEASSTFEAGLQRAEKAYEAAFEEAKGGIGTWLTTWGSDWERHIENALATARREYLAQVDTAIDEVANLVEAKLKKAKQQVADGRKEVEDFVNGLDQSVKQFGEEALQSVSTEFDAMGAEIDQRRDGLIDKLTQQYKASYERMSATEEKLRSENKSLWQRVYDATVGVIKQIIAFKDMLLGVLGRAASVIGDIIAHPIRFLSNLVAGVMQGLKNFMSKIGMYLQKGLMEWLFGALAGAGLVMPEKFDLQGIISIILQVLGLTYANFRARAVAIVGEQIVSSLEKAAEVFKVVITEGIPGLWRFIKEKLADLKSMVFDAIFDFIKDRIIMAGITWIIGLLNPASAFFKACKAIYDIVMFFINRGSQILALVNAVIDSLASIAKGAIGVAAEFVENALAKAIPVAIGFLASLLGLGDPAEPVRKTVEKARSPVNKAIDWVINLAVKGVNAAGKFIGGLFGHGKESDEEKQAKLDQAMTAAEKAVARFAGKRVGEMVLRPVLAMIKLRYGLKRMTAVQEGEYWTIIGEINPVRKEKTSVKVEDPKESLDGETKYVEIDSQGRRMLREEYQGSFMIRTRMYGSGRGYGAEGKTHRDKIIKSLRRNKDGTSNPDGLYWEPENGRIVELKPPTDPTVEHRPSVVEHWNSEGRKTNQKNRRSFFTFSGKLNEMKVIDRQRNSELGGEGTYNPVVEDTFKGPGEGE
ncbi:MAG: DUF4157 domain-containing protein [Candidatus Binatia bacterium]